MASRLTNIARMILSIRSSLYLAAAVLLAMGIGASYGNIQAGLFAAGLVAGSAFLYASFGFTTAWRELLSGGDTRPFRAQLTMIAIASLIMIPIIYTSNEFSGFVRPVGISLLVGAFLFGCGAQIANGCSSGAMFHLGQGRWQSIGTLGAFTLGVMLAVRDYDDWLEAPIFFAGSLGQDQGPIIATATTLTLILALVWALKGRSTPLFQGFSPLFVAAIAIAGANIAILLISGRPWSVAQGFALLGTQFDLAYGLEWDLDFSSFWSSSLMASRLESPILADSFLMPNLGLIAGAILTGLAISRFKPQPLKILPFAGGLLGGLMMGYGATIAFGCNIGALFSGIASASYHGWIWLLPTLLGTWVGIRLRPAFGHPA